MSDRVRALLSSRLAMVLVGPVAWYLLFWGVYLVSEWRCARGGGGGELGGLAVLAVAVAGAGGIVTIGLAGAAVAIARTTWADERPSRMATTDEPDGRIVFRRVAVQLSVLFSVASLALVVPALVLGPC